MTTSFGLLNMIMGIIVEQVVDFRQSNNQEVNKQREEQRVFELQMLRQIFEHADRNKDGYVTVLEFTNICKRANVQALFEELGIPVSRARLAERLFHVLDADSAGRMDVESFVQRIDVLLREGRLVQTDATLLLMDVRALDRRFDRFEKSLNHSLQEISGRLSSFSVHSDEVANSNIKPPDGAIRGTELVARDSVPSAASEIEAFKNSLVGEQLTELRGSGNGLVLSSGSEPCDKSAMSVSCRLPPITNAAEVFEELHSFFSHVRLTLSQQDTRLMSELEQVGKKLLEIQAANAQLQSQLAQPIDHRSLPCVDLPGLEARLSLMVTTEMKQLEDNIVRELAGSQTTLSELSRKLTFSAPLLGTFESARGAEPLSSIRPSGQQDVDHATGRRTLSC